MHEFEEMKKQELVQQYNDQNKLIDQYKGEVLSLNDALRKRAEDVRVKNSNTVRQESMHLETLKTAE